MSYTYIIILLLSADIDECVADSPCDANAVCYNTESGYSCQCGEGYTGNGTHCEGTHILLSLSSYFTVPYL